MAAAERTHSGGGVLILIVLAIGGLMMCNAATVVETTLQVPGVGNVETQPHAVERHGAEAEEVRASMSTGLPPRRYRCKDGKEYLFKYRADGRVDLMVKFGGYEKTAFITTRGYLEDVLQDDQCIECNGYHDACNGPIPAPAY